MSNGMYVILCANAANRNIPSIIGICIDEEKANKERSALERKSRVQSYINNLKADFRENYIAQRSPVCKPEKPAYNNSREDYIPYNIEYDKEFEEWKAESDQYNNFVMRLEKEIAEALAVFMSTIDEDTIEVPDSLVSPYTYTVAQAPVLH